MSDNISFKTPHRGIHVYCHDTDVPDVADAFLTRFVQQQAKRTKAYISNYVPGHDKSCGDNPYRYKENDIAAIQAAALGDLTPNFMNDMYIEREGRKEQPKKKTRYGRVDFWAQYDFDSAKHDVFLEMKHSCNRLVGGRANGADYRLYKSSSTSPNALWTKACKQIRGIKAFIAKEPIYQNELRIAFQSVFFYDYLGASSPHPGKPDMPSIIGDSQKRFPGANWIGVWTPPPKMQMIRYRDGEDEEETYVEFNPFIAFFAKVQT